MSIPAVEVDVMGLILRNKRDEEPSHRGSDRAILYFTFDPAMLLKKSHSSPKADTDIFFVTNYCMHLEVEKAKK